MFGVTQEEISRWQRYVREGQWAQLLSLQGKSLLTDDVRQQIVEVWAVNIWQTADQVWERLTQQGVAVTERLVQEAGRQSGLMKIRACLKEQFSQGPDGLTGDAIRAMPRAELATLPSALRALTAATRKAEDYRDILKAAYPDRLRLHTYAVVALGFERLVWVKM